MGATAVHITDATFEAEVLRSPILTIVDLWAEWCLPCKRIAPLLDDLATEHAGKLKLTKLDVDSNPGTPERYGVTGIPTLLVFKDGKLQDTIVGFQPKDRLAGRLMPYLAS
jgi:thioredoxin 1